MTAALRIDSPDSPHLQRLCAQLESLASRTDTGEWPAEQLRLCGEYGVFEWFLDARFGGQGWSDADVIRGYLQLSAACLTTTFIITQRTGACRRIAISENEAVGSALLPALVRGDSFATVGISHLTTSRRHLARPVLLATETAAGFRLDGYSPWVTGADRAQTIVVGAALEDGRQLLAALPTHAAGVSTPPPADLVGLGASHTGPVNCDGVEITKDALLAGPIENVMQQGIGAKSGGLQTSTLAVGLSNAALKYIEKETGKRENLRAPVDALSAEAAALEADLLRAANGDADCSLEQLRTRANSLALRSSQAALSAAKGAGYVVGHPAGRWCREALFFLVWSCPQPVMDANLCELAGIES